MDEKRTDEDEKQLLYTNKCLSEGLWYLRCWKCRNKSKNLNRFLFPFYVSEWIINDCILKWFGNMTKKLVCLCECIHSHCEHHKHFKILNCWCTMSKSVCENLSMFGYNFDNKTKLLLYLTYRQYLSEKPSTFLVPYSPDTRKHHHHVPSKILFVTSNFPNLLILSPVRGRSKGRTSKWKSHIRSAWKMF